MGWTARTITGGVATVVVALGSGPTLAQPLMVASALPTPGPASDGERAPLPELRQLAAALLTPQVGDLWPRLTPGLKQALGTQQALWDFGVTLATALGPEVWLNGERIFAQGGTWIYTRRAAFQKSHTMTEITVGIQDDGQIAPLGIRASESFHPEAASKYLDYATKTVLRLPFAEQWEVGWGGRTVAQNYHAEYPDQRFAYDLGVVRHGSTHSGDGTHCSDYYCYGLPILAPGDGVIVSLLDGLPDNVPGKTNPADHAGGNHVCIDHGNGEYSMLCHMQPGSLKVKQGQRVKAGQPIGLCGNSGNTSNPHLHYHLQTTAVFFKGEGLPAQFQRFRADGQRVARGEPVQGQFIQQDRR